MTAHIMVLALAFLAVDAVMDTVTVSGGFVGAVGLAVLYGIVSGIIGTVLRLLALPLVMITVGLFEFVINAGLLLFVDWLTDWLAIEGILSALAASVLLSVASVAIGLIVRVVRPSSRH